ncbi:L,D-transpeptidase [Ramlibacter tataouinensis]|uniref:L,D-TPase catalytic domain-containing protein n=1 Tax=Ramlibacter tataouinensis (strain ATCC BAA-407 / DSM 14655 / LMG 21543 / TTB310) TaxID=365046 RepID=F5Y528_RAMTT|nr:L,D-transpeptidase [Ramlibacter tataouinensis]AEG93868.1 Conserved hypothetical protein [Ramlibacter tataouinensis TTB310]
MGWKARALAAWWLACGMTVAAAAGADKGRRGMPVDTREMAQWVMETDDAAGRPFAIVDKKAAQLFVFEAGGRLVGSTPVLLGATPGDHSTPGVGQRAQTGDVGLHERTTPAGRFASAPGRNIDGEPVVWFDYGAALAIHRLRPGSARERRQARLASATPADNRASLGCVVVPVAFYEKVVEPLLGRVRGVVYVLPEKRPVRDFLEAM